MIIPSLLALVEFFKHKRKPDALCSENYHGIWCFFENPMYIQQKVEKYTRNTFCRILHTNVELEELFPGTQYQLQTPTSDSINKPVQLHLQNISFFHHSNWKTISEACGFAVQLRCTQFPA